MLGWFKKKFKKTEEDGVQSPADLKIPVAPRTFAIEPQLEPNAISTENDEISTTSSTPSSVESTIAEDHQPQPDILEESEEVQELTEPEADTKSDALEENTDDEVSETVQEIQEDPAVDELLDKDQVPEPDTQEELLPPDVETTPLKIPVSPEITPTPKAETKPAATKKTFLARLAERLSRTRETFTYQLDSLFLGKKEIDAKLLDDLEELLITADLGVNITHEILDHAKRKVKRKELSDPNSLKLVLKEKLKSFIIDYHQDAALVMPDEGPFIIMVIGVNGVGKTTTIGKIAHKFKNSGQSVLLVAADTFRAAAISQLKIWGERNNIPVISKAERSDPSAVVYDGIAHAKAKEYDVVLVDTAGRLHTQDNLMEELKKIKRVMGKQLDGAPHEIMLVIDATTGQNGISQAKLFNAAVGITGIALTKLDGTAKGGIVANICKELKTPIRFIGVGEQLEDLRDFDPDEFIEALFQSSADTTE